LVIILVNYKYTWLNINKEKLENLLRTITEYKFSNADLLKRTYDIEK